MYLENDKQIKKKIAQINEVRKYKKIYFSFELVEVDSYQSTNTFWNNDEESLVIWKFSYITQESKLWEAVIPYRGHLSNRCIHRMWLLYLILNNI